MQPGFYCRQARVSVREGWVMGGFGVEYIWYLGISECRPHSGSPG